MTTQAFTFSRLRDQIPKLSSWLLCNLDTIFFIIHLAAPKLNLAHLQQGSLTHLMLIILLLHKEPKFTESLVTRPQSPVECTVRFELVTYWFCMQLFNSLGHSPHLCYLQTKHKIMIRLDISDLICTQLSNLLKKVHIDFFIMTVC